MNMNPPINPENQTLNPSLHSSIQAAGKRIAPLWTLKNFVAVNPFVGLSDRHFLAAATLIQQVGHAEMLMPPAYYREAILSGRIQAKHLQAALKALSKTTPDPWAKGLAGMNLEQLQAGLAEAAGRTQPWRILTFADWLDVRDDSGWAAFVVEEISKWCSAYYDQGQSSWRMPWRQLALFAAWKQAAQLDANAEMTGLEGFRALVASLPEDYTEIIGQVLVTLGVPEARQADFLHRQLMSIHGWSSYVQFQVREKSQTGQNDDSLTQLLAIRLVYDLALWHGLGGEARSLAAWSQTFKERENPQAAENLVARYLAQQALEQSYQAQLIARLKARRPVTAAPSQKWLQAVFCIDVRSEVFRRALEGQSEHIETIGFAGFFGMTIEYVKFGQPAGTARCPVLLTPKIKVRESLCQPAGGEASWLRQMDFRQSVNGAWNSFKTSAISCFSFVETAGLWFGVRLAQDSLALNAPEVNFATRGDRSRPNTNHEVCRPDTHGHELATGITPDDQIKMAAFALKNMGLVANFAKIVFICGHGSATTNNPYGSALDCGACGGHAGDVNARVAAQILNNPAVRAGLREQGISIPAETVFLAGLHNTSTDEILIYDAQNLSPKQAAELDQVQNWLAAASQQARRERSISLGLGDETEAGLAEKVFARSRDWAQVRPEWGLANNAAFIAAPRELTRGLNLEGRVFLHNYDPAKDPEKATLELIMVAPMVVASWINLQYYGSTVDNRRFGSGNKVLHNVVGTFGVWQGNGGDLQPGLPMQSLHDGVKWMHEPLKLNVFIAAEPSAIEAIVARQPGVRELLENGWVNLLAMDPSGQRFWRWCGSQFVEQD